MSLDAEPTIVHDPGARTTAENVAGYLSSFAIFMSFLGIFWHPLRLIIPSLLIALIASGMTKGRLQLAAVLFGAFSFVVGLAVAVATAHAIW